MGMDRHEIEQVFLQKVDNDASIVRAKLVRGELNKLTEKERCSWVRFIMSLRLRQPSIVNDLRLGASEMLRGKLSDQDQLIEAPLNFPNLEEWTETIFPGAIENFGLSFFHELIDDEFIGTKLINLKWGLVAFSDKDHALLLGDNPCVFHGDIDGANFALMLPISPCCAFVATKGDQVAYELSKADRKKLSKNFNEATVRLATKYIYASNDSSERFILNRRPPSLVTGSKRSHG